MYLGLDFGTSSVKGVIIDDKQKILATASSPLKVSRPHPGWSEQNPEDWWKAANNVVKALRKAKPKAVAAVKGIGMSGQQHGATLLDKNGKVLRPCILWNDARSFEECKDILRDCPDAPAITGNVPLAGFTAPKLVWVRKHEPKVFDQVAKVLLPKDYIRYRLTGDFATEVSDASGTLLLDVKARAWHTGLMGKLQIDPALLPRVVESQTVTGTLSPEAAAMLGLAPGVPVVGGGGDQAAGAVGTGVVLPGLVSASMGTSGVIFAASGSPQTDPLGRVHTMCHAIPDTWCVFGCMLSAGGSLQWLRNTLFAAEIKKAGDPGSIYPAIIKEAQSAAAGAENLFFLPYLTGERCPHPDPAARGAFIGLTPRHDRRHLIRAVLEGITFGMREQIQIFREMKIPIQQVRASGGGARSEFWRQLQADMYNAPVVTINVSEGAALGAAILAAVGQGHYASVPQATKAIIQIRTTAKPSKKAAALYDAQYQKYAALYPSLKPNFRSLCG